MPPASHSRRYSAFISYRHADNTQEGRRWAEWLHRALERYVVPPDLIGTPNLRGEPIRDSLYPIFRDEDELPANADLATGIRAALEVSDHLIVLCSPRSAVSPWVRKEVREFKELGRSDRILAIIIAGEPNADDPAKAREGILRDEECFCEELRFGAVREDGTLDWTIRTEPLAADLRPIETRAEGFVTAEAYREHLTLNSSLAPDKIATRTEAYRQQLDHALIKVIAGLLNVPLGQLVDRDAAHRAEIAKKNLERSQAEAAHLRTFSRRLVVAGATALVLALAALTFAAYGWWQAKLAQIAETKAAAQRDEARYNEGLAWLLRAEVADERAHRYPDTLLYAAQAIGFEGVGRPQSAELPLRYIPPDREAFARAAKWIADRPAYRPVWASPLSKASVSAMAMSLSGHLLALAYADGRVVLWDLSTGKQSDVFPAGSGRVNDLAFDPAEKILALSMPDTTQLFDLAKQSLSATRPGAGRAIAWSPGGEMLVVAGEKGLTLWRGDQSQIIASDLGVPPTRIAFSAENSLIAAVYPGKGVRVFFPHAGTPANAWITHSASATSVAISPDGKRIAIGLTNGVISLWSSADARQLGIVPGELRHRSAVLDLAFRPDGGHLASVSDDGTIKLWSVAFDPRGTIDSIEHASRLNSESTANVYSDINYALWNFTGDTPGLLATLCGHQGPVSRVAYAPGGEFLASAGADGSGRLWSVIGKPEPHGDLFVYMDQHFYIFDPGTQHAQWGGGEGFVGAAPSIVPFARDSAAMMADAQQAAKENRWHRVDLRLKQLAALGVAEEHDTLELRAAHAAFAQPEKPFTNAEGMSMLWCPSTGPEGFLMGSPPAESGRFSWETQHKVVLSSGYWLGKYEVTQAEWKTLMGSTPSTFPITNMKAPVENVTWHEAVDFCERLTDRERSRGTLLAGWEYALPSEAQWEYACRAGTTTAYSFGDDAGKSPEFGNFEDDKTNLKDGRLGRSDGFQYSAPVGSFKANAWGFHDMHGNVFEWCADALDLVNDLKDADYAPTTVTDPLVTVGTRRVLRGGSWNSPARSCRSANRGPNPPTFRSVFLGFRVAIVPCRSARVAAQEKPLENAPEK